MYVTPCFLEVHACYFLLSGRTLFLVVWRYVTPCYPNVPYSLLSGGTLLPVIWTYLTPCYPNVPYSLLSGGTLLSVIWRYVSPCNLEVRFSLQYYLKVPYSLLSGGTLLPVIWRYITPVNPVIWRYVTPCHLVGCRLVGLGFNATLTAKVISWRSVTHMCFLAFLHQSLSSGGTLLPVILKFVTSCYLEVRYSLLSWGTLFLSSGGTLLPVI